MEGLGFVLGDGVAGIDLDDAIGLDGKASSWAREIIGQIESYLEVTPSGRGYHLLFRTEPGATTINQTGNNVEVYQREGGHFFTMTFKPHPKSKLELMRARGTLARALGRVSEGKTSLGSVEVDSVQKDPAGQPGAIHQLSSLTPIRVVNVLAMMRLEAWVPELFPAAEESKLGYWRVPAESLGESHAGLVEALSITPLGIRDFGLHDQDEEKRDGKRTPVDMLMPPYGEITDPMEAARVLMAMLGGADALRALTPAPGGPSVPAAFHNVLLDRDETLVTPAWPTGTLPKEIENYAACVARRTCAAEAVGEFAHKMALAAMVPHGVEVDVFGDGTYRREPALFSMLVGRSGSSKSAPLNLALNPLMKAEEEWGAKHLLAIAKHKVDEAEHKALKKKQAKSAGRSKGAAVVAAHGSQGAGQCCDPPADWIKPEAPTRRRRLVSDSTAEALSVVFARNHEGLVAHVDELAGFFGGLDRYGSGSRGGSKDSAMYLNLFDGRMPAVDRVTRDHVESKSTSFSILGTTQPKVLAPMIANLSGDGLLQRFIPCVLGEPTTVRDVSDIPAYLSHAYAGTADRLIELRQTCGPMVLRFAPAAMAVWRDADQWTRASGLGLTQSEAERGFVGKMPDLLARVSLALHLVDWALDAATDDMGLSYETPRAAIGEATVRRAWKWLRDFALPNVRQVYAMGENAGRLEAVHELARWLKTLPIGAEAFTLRDIYRSIHKYRYKRNEPALHSALTDLESAGWIVPKSEKEWTICADVHGATEAAA